MFLNYSMILLQLAFGVWYLKWLLSHLRVENRALMNGFLKSFFNTFVWLNILNAFSTRWIVVIVLSSFKDLICTLLLVLVRVHSQEARNPHTILGFIACSKAPLKNVCISSLRSTDPEVCHIHNKKTASISCLGLLCLWCLMHCSLTVHHSKGLCLRKSQYNFMVEHWRGSIKTSLTLLFYKLLKMYLNIWLSRVGTLFTVEH